MSSSSSITEPRRLAVGVVGIGRMGRQHALNALHRVHRTRLLCVCSPAPADIKWAEENLVPYGVRIYQDFKKMLSEPGLDAVLVASSTAVHHEHVMKSIQAGFHVLCEKPLAMNVAEARQIAELAAQPRHKRQKIMTAFSRRFDDSYRNALKAIKDGKVGTPVVIRSETRDFYDDSEFYYRYVMSNPGIFIDTGSHDVDLTLMFLGGELRPKSCQAIGNIARHQDVAKIADVDNAVGIVEWYPMNEGETAPISYYYFSRIMQHGFDNPTEIIGTKGVLKINLHPRRDLIVSSHRGGLGNSVMPDFYERYEKAFVTELQTFADCVLDNTALPYELDVTIKGMEIVAALQECLRSGVKVEWAKNGRRKDSLARPKI